MLFLRNLILWNIKIPQNAKQGGILIFVRARTCILLCEGQQCSQCRKYEVTVRSKDQRKCTSHNLPAKSCAPISMTSPQRVKLTLQSVKLQCKQQERKIQQLREEISVAGKRVDSFHNDFKTIFSSQPSEKIPPFMRLFWEEQQKYIQAGSRNGIRYHPMIIKYCLKSSG